MLALGLSLALLVVWCAFFAVLTVSSKIRWVYIVSNLAVIPLMYFVTDRLPHTISNPATFFATTIFIMSLITSIVSDMSEMVVMRFCSIWLAPIWTLFSLLGIIPATPIQSLLGLTAGYILMWSAGAITYKFSGKKGLGLGDVEFIAMIGAFLGLFPMLITLQIGAAIGLFVGIPYLYFFKKNIREKMPFAPALAIGALIALFLT